jgi:hypothetical protein
MSIVSHQVTIPQLPEGFRKEELKDVMEKE